MVRRCCICGKKKDKETANSPIRFFRIPSSKSPIFNQWIETIRTLKNKPSERLKKNSIVCSRHFLESCFLRTKNTFTLKKGSLPTIRDPCSQSDASPTLNSGQSDASPTINSRKIDEDEKPKEDEPPENNRPSPSEEAACEGSSDSLSPPTLQPLPEMNSDYEEDVEDPPDLEFLNKNNDDEDATYLTSLSEYDAIQTDHIGSVADILGPDFLPEGPVQHETERSEASSKAEVVEVDGQTILSFASAEELEEYALHCEPTHHQARRTDNTIENTGKSCQPTPSLTPSPCSSPFSSSQIDLPANISSVTRDASSDSSRRSPIPSHSEDSAWRDQEVQSSVEADMERATDSNSGDNGAVILRNQFNSSEEANDSNDVLRYSESEDSLAAEIMEKCIEVVKKEPGMSTSCSAMGDESNFVNSKVLPELKTDGTITPEIAAFAVSAIKLSPQPVVVPSEEELQGVAIAPSIEESQTAGAQSKVFAPKRSTGSGRGRRPGPVSTSNRIGKRSEPAIFDKSASADGTDEIFNVDTTVNETAFEDLIVHEEEYAEDYDIPAKTELATASCGSLSCRLGCICTSLQEAGSRRKQPPEHCPLPECMLECVCGYKRGKSSGRRTFVSLLKGNESFYSKINWSNERSRRERKVPERYSEYQLETETIKQPNVSRGANSRGNSRPSSPTYKPPSSNYRQYQHRRVQQNQSQQSTPTVPTKKNETFKLKISSDEIKLLRWDSYVSLSEVYVAPDQEVMCMDHNTYSCPCIASNRRIIRIPSKFVPPSVRIDGNQVSPTNPNVKQEENIQQLSNNSRNVAKKHTHPIMRTNKEKKVQESDQSNEEGTPKPSAMSKMRKFLQDERFQLQKLITEEKTRAFDDEIDLTVKLGQTVQLVAWIRFHSIYHAGKMHIRFLSRRSGPVILVMRPTEIVAADITCNIKDMKGKTNVPEIVKELLDPCISPEETSRYAFLMCDGVKWELVGCLSLQISNPNQSSNAPASIDQTPAPAEAAPSSDIEIQNEAPATVEESGPPVPNIPVRMTTGKDTQNAVDFEPIPRAITPDTQLRLEAMDERRRLLEEKLEKINTRLNFQPPKPSTNYKLLKPSKCSSSFSSQPNTSTNLTSPFDARPGDQTPLAPTTVSSVAPRRDPSESALVPGVVLIPDFAPMLYNRPTFMTDLSMPEGRPDDYFASMQLVQFSKLALQTQGNYIKELTNKARRLYQAKQPTVESMSPCSTPPPADNRRVSEMSLLKETSSFDAGDSNLGEQNGYQHIRIVPQQHAIHSTPTTLSSFRPIAPAMQPSQAGSGQFSMPAAVRNNGLPPNLLIRKLAPNSSSLISNQSLIGIVPTSSSSVLKVSGAVSAPTQGAGLPKITSVSSMALSNACLQKSKLIPMKITGDIEKPIAFPEAISVEVSPVHVPNSRIQLFNHRMKVVLEALTGEHEALCPNRTNMLLPLHNEDDEWSLVAVDAVPQAGLPVPGLQVIVPLAVLEKALSTALERQARVSFPLHVQAIPSNPVLKKGFGVYSTPQLPRHTFLGPFPANYLKSKSTLPTYIKLLAVAEDPLTAALKSITEDPIVIEVGSPPSNSAALDDSIVIEKVVKNSTQSSGTSINSGKDAISIEPAGTNDLSCSEKFQDILNSMEFNPPVEDSVFVSTGTESIEGVENLPGLSISRVDSMKEDDDSNDSCDLVIVEDRKDKENEDVRSMPGNDSDDGDYIDSTEKNWRDDDTCWPESVAYTNGNSMTNSPATSEQMGHGLTIEPLGSTEKGNFTTDSSRKRLIDAIVDEDSSLTRQSPKRTRRPTEKARMFAEELKASRSSSASSSQSSQVEIRRLSSPSNLTKRNSFQRELHIIKEQERRGLLGKLFRDLDSLIAPNSGPRSKIVVLKHATNTLKALEEQSKGMDSLYGLLKARRNTLLRQRFKLFNELPADVKPIFQCLLDSTPLPEKHLSVDAGLARNEISDSHTDRSQNGRHEDSEEIDIIAC